MTKPLLIAALILGLPNAGRAEWVHAAGSYTFSSTMTEAEACQEAEMRANSHAVRQLTGETLAADETMRCTEQNDQSDCIRNSTVWTAVGGEIRATRDRSVIVTQELENFRKCAVSFEADVRVAAGKPDPGFDVGVSLNTTVFRDGEALSLTLKPSQPMVVQVFQWLPYEKGDAQVSRIFPNAFDNAAKIDKPVTIPTPPAQDRYELKLSFPAAVGPSRKMVDEYLMVVATRKPIEFLSSYSLEGFNRAIAEIPLGDRRIVKRQYNIVRRD